MRVDRHADPAAFWRDTKDFLEHDEAGNAQALAIVSRHAVEPGDTPSCGLTVADRGETLAAAMLTAKGTLCLFADTGNLTANGVYRRVGFRAAGEHAHLTRVEADS